MERVVMWKQISYGMILMLWSPFNQKRQELVIQQWMPLGFVLLDSHLE
jgi:hypothetical protein